MQSGTAPLPLHSWNTLQALTLGCLICLLHTNEGVAKNDNFFKQTIILKLIKVKYDCFTRSPLGNIYEGKVK